MKESEPMDEIVENNDPEDGEEDVEDEEEVVEEDDEAVEMEEEEEDAVGNESVPEPVDMATLIAQETETLKIMLSQTQREIENAKVLDLSQIFLQLSPSLNITQEECAILTELLIRRKFRNIAEVRPSFGRERKKRPANEQVEKPPKKSKKDANSATPSTLLTSDSQQDGNTKPMEPLKIVLKKEPKEKKEKENNPDKPTKAPRKKKGTEATAATTTNPTNNATAVESQQTSAKEAPVAE